MREFKYRQKLKKRIYSKFTIAVLILILAFIAHGTWSIFQKSQASKHKLALSQAAYDELKERHDSIGEQITHLGTESGVEEEVRTKYNMVKEGEQIIVLVDDEQLETTPEEPKNKGFWTRIIPWLN